VDIGGSARVTATASSRATGDTSEFSLRGILAARLEVGFGTQCAHLRSSACSSAASSPSVAQKRSCKNWVFLDSHVRDCPYPNINVLQGDPGAVCRPSWAALRHAPSKRSMRAGVGGEKRSRLRTVSQSFANDFCTREITTWFLPDRHKQPRRCSTKPPGRWAGPRRRSVVLTRRYCARSRRNVRSISSCLPRGRCPTAPRPAPRPPPATARTRGDARGRRWWCVRDQG
jgi:hypothetical protein